MATERPTLTLTWTDPETGADHSQTVTPPATIGRDSEATIHLTDREVSRRHARLARMGDEVLLIDTSANGVRVNGVMQEEVTVHDGDRVEIGPYTLTFHIGHGAVTVEQAAEPDIVAATDMAMAPEPVATLPDVAASPTEREEAPAVSSMEPVVPDTVPDAIEAEPPPVSEPELEQQASVMPEPAMVAAAAEAPQPVAVNVERDASGAPVVREFIFRLREQVLVRTSPSASTDEQA